MNAIYKSKFKPVDELVQQIHSGLVLVDVRSENEFFEDHIPGAMNMPVLTDTERAEVGTLYKANSFEARQLGARLIAGNLPKILHAIENISSNSNKIAGLGSGKPEIEFVVYCWRGGMRSRSLFTVMDLIGYKTKLIDGGYKTYRKMVNDYFLRGTLPDCLTIYGPSGSGKTELIDFLENKNFPVIQFEKYANHKGSILGGDFETQPSQKMFESKIYFSLNCSDAKTSVKKVIVEGESRNIGKLSIPANLFQKILNGENVWIELPIEERAKRLAEEYTDKTEYLVGKVEFLKKYLSSKITEEIILNIKKDNRVQAAYLLLKHHYDLFYKKYSPESSKSRKYEAVIQSKTFRDLKEKILDYLKDKFQRSL